jgi:cytochrome c oxidase assembly protein subunit 15
VPANVAVRDDAQSLPARRLAQRLAAAILNPSPASMRALGLAAVVTSAGIILTGAGVRLSQSGLGCPDWPACTRASVVASGATGDTLVHRWIEFGNRLVTAAIFVVAIAVLAAAWRYRDAETGSRRRDLVWLAAAQPAGIAAQAALGGIVVLTKLNPGWVSLHFLVSVALVAAAVALWVRAGEGTAKPAPLARPEVRLFALVLTGVVAAMLAAGTVVTGTGPLAGAASVPRYHLPLSGVTQLHADIGWLLGGLALGLAAALHLTGAPVRSRRLGLALLALLGSQGVIGYVQYFSGLPAGLVWFHVAGAVLIWITVLLLVFSLRDRELRPAPAAVPGQERGNP